MLPFFFRFCIDLNFYLCKLLKLPHHKKIRFVYFSFRFHRQFDIISLLLDFIYCHQIPSFTIQIFSVLLFPSLRSISNIPSWILSRFFFFLFLLMNFLLLNLIVNILHVHLRYSLLSSFNSFCLNPLLISPETSNFISVQPPVNFLVG